MILLAGPALARESLSGPVNAEVIRVIDGDTFDVRAQIWVGHFIETRIRINGLDTPELRSQCEAERQHAEEAKLALSDLLQDGRIVLTDIQNGKYAGRVLARAQTPGGIDVSDFMIDQGLGRTYDGGKRAGWCAEETAAKTR
ncbi:MAG: thermonuclease family protein [Pseudomonadota bacterium]